MSNWVNGREPIPLDYLKALGDLFGCRWEYLCGMADYRSIREEWEETWNNATDSENDIEFQKAYKVDGTINLSVTCKEADIKDLILGIARAGGYPLIMDAIKGLLDPIAPHSGYSQICEGLKELDVYIEKY
jgi:hypothetical protein